MLSVAVAGAKVLVLRREIPRRNSRRRNTSRLRPAAAGAPCQTRPFPRPWSERLFDLVQISMNKSGNLPLEARFV
jgi:hypothetical protein